MKDEKDEAVPCADTLQKPGPDQDYWTSPATQQLRAVGRRRRDAEEKLEHHLADARHNDKHDDVQGAGD